MKSMVTVAMDAAREAGEHLRANHRTALTVEAKEDRSLVTNVDREAEHLIVSRIEAAFPGHDIIGEERGRTSRGSDHLWIIDPMDGTHNYIRGMSTYGVSIGMMRDAVFAVGVIFMPETGEMYAAERGSGAFRNGTRIAVSARSALSACTVAFDSELRVDTARKLRVLERLSTSVFNVRLFGSSARTLSYIAEGVLDGVVELSDKLWDFAAGTVLIEEAGGRMTGLAGAALSARDTAYVASNGLVHEPLLGIAGPA